MTINYRRLLKLLEPSGFACAKRSAIEKTLIFMRPAESESLFQYVEVAVRGKKNDWVAATIGLSTTYFFMTKGLYESEFLWDVADIKELVDSYGFWIPNRGLAFVSTKEQAIAWEKKLAAIAIPKLDEMQTRVGTMLLQRTHDVREVVSKYLTFLTLTNEIDYEIARLEKLASDDLISRAKRWSDYPGVLALYGKQQTFLLATLCILLFHQSVESKFEVLLASNPLECQPLMWRIKLLADRIMRQIKYPSPDYH